MWRSFCLNICIFRETFLYLPVFEKLLMIIQRKIHTMLSYFFYYFFQRMALVKESFAIQMPNVSERFLKYADSASVEMVGKETVGIALVRFVVHRRSFYLFIYLL